MHGGASNLKVREPGFTAFVRKFLVFYTSLFDCNGRVNFLLVNAGASGVKVPVFPFLLLVFEGLL